MTHKQSRKMPKNEATPLGTPRANTARATGATNKLKTLGTPPIVTKKSSKDSLKKVVDNTIDVPVSSSQVEVEKTPTAIPQSASVAPTAQESRPMAEISLTRDPKARKSTSIVYTSPQLRGGVRIAKSAFVNGTPDEGITLTGNFAAPAVPRAKETKEERKARLASMPKLTLAEKVEKRRKQLEAMEAKLAKSAAPAI